MGRSIYALCAIVVSLMSISVFSCAQQRGGKSSFDELPTKADSNLTIGIIGAGNVGGTLGKKWAKAGYKVLFSNQHPETLKALVSEAGPLTSAVSVIEVAQKANIIVLAIPFKAESEVSTKIAPYISGKIVILCDNAYSGRDGDIAIAARKSGVALYAQQHYYPQARFVRAFSSLPVSMVGAADADHKVNIPYAVDDTSLKVIVEKLINAVDGTPKYIGAIKESKSLDF